MLSCLNSANLEKESELFCSEHFFVPAAEGTVGELSKGLSVAYSSATVAYVVLNIASFDCNLAV